MKKFVRITFTALLCLVMSLTVSAAYDITASGDEWTLEGNGTLWITGELDSTEPLWSEYSAQIRKVVLNNEAAPFVWDGMFADCTSLEEIEVPENCRWASVIDGVLFGSGMELKCYPAAKPETDYTIPEDCSLICGRAFAGASHLTNLTIPGGLIYIGDYAFENCTALTEVTAADGAFTLFFPDNAFEGCSSLDPQFIEQFCWNESFHDVTPQTEWFEGIRYVCEKGLMNGISPEYFAPDTGMTRAMFVTVLGRLAEMQDFYTDENLVWVSFEDVEEDEWYTYYVNWAATNGIVTGYGNGYFGVNDKVTIEQAAMILYRYADLDEIPAYDMEGDYTDTDEISDWAKDAMRWITAEEIYTGYDGELRPKQNASRALVAEMLYHYVKAYPERDDWGLTLTVADVTSTGLSLTFTQSGGNPSGRLQTGMEYALEVRNLEEWTWVPVENTITGWPEEALLLNMDGRTEIPINWEWGYGVLPAGEYRIVKKIMDFRSTGDYDTATFYARFTIE